MVFYLCLVFFARPGEKHQTKVKIRAVRKSYNNKEQRTKQPEPANNERCMMRSSPCHSSLVTRYSSERGLGDCEGAVRGRHASVDRHMQQRLGDLAGRGAGVLSCADMQRQLVGA